MVVCLSKFVRDGASDNLKRSNMKESSYSSFDHVIKSGTLDRTRPEAPRSRNVVKYT
jgi:hypothetical protein